MAAADWYRKETWTAADAADFVARLGRARAGNRPQYLCIQAGSLMGAAVARPEIALDLYREALALEPTGTFSADAATGMGNALAALGRDDAALAAFEEALRLMATARTAKTAAWTDYAWLVATRDLGAHRQRALDLLDEYRATDLNLPVEIFRVEGGRALLLADEAPDRAAEAATLALAAAAKLHSGVERHPGFGLVAPLDPAIRRRLETIAQGGRKPSLLGRLLGR